MYISIYNSKDYLLRECDITDDIVELYERIMEERKIRDSTKKVETSQWQKDTIEDTKNLVLTLDDEIRGVLRLNWNCSIDHATHVLVRNHIGDKRIPEEVWVFWKQHVDEVRKWLMM